MSKKYRCLITAFLMAATLPGCGSSDAPGVEATPAGVAGSLSFTTTSEAVGIGAAGEPLAGADQGISVVGATMCIACHSEAALAGSDKVIDATGYLAAGHVVHSTQIDQESARTEGCAFCHDPIGDGPALEAYLDSANVPAGGLAAVTCEVCHGAGGEHNGIGSIPNANPDFELCGKCHGVLPDIAVSGHSQANNILDDYKASKHHLGKVRTSDVCMRCHSGEGHRAYVEETLGLAHEELVAFMADQPPVGTAPIQCRTCHDPHTGGLRLAATLTNRDQYGSIMGADGAIIEEVQVFSSQFNLCTSCHQAFLKYTYAADTGLFTYELDGTRTPFYHPTLTPPDYPMANDWRAIWDTHFEYLDPADEATVLIPGYNIDAAAENACTSCHDPHAAGTPLG